MSFPLRRALIVAGDDGAGPGGGVAGGAGCWLSACVFFERYEANVVTEVGSMYNGSRAVGHVAFVTEVCSVGKQLVFLLVNRNYVLVM